MAALSGREYNMDTLLLASIADATNILLWFQTKDGQKGRNRPKSFVNTLFSEDQEEKCAAFNTAEEYEKARRSFLERE